MGNRFAPFVARDGTGGVIFGNGTASTAGAPAMQGFNLTPDGAIASNSAGVLDHYHAGLPFDANGRVLTDSVGAVVRWDQGVPFTASDRVAIGAYTEGVARYDQGVGFTATGRISIPSPPDPSDLVLHVDHTLGVNTAGVSDGVNIWEDQSGQGNDLLQGTDAERPAVTADGILFDGVGQSMNAAFTLLQPETVYIKFRQITWVLNGRVFDGNTSTSGACYQNNVRPKLILNAGVATATSLGMTMGQFQIAAVVINGAASTIQINDGDPIPDDDAGAVGMGGFTLGARGPGTSNFGNIEVKEVLVYKTAHNLAERAAVMAYMGIPVIPELVMDLDWETGVTVTGSGVSLWEDQSVYGNDLLQGTDTDRPVVTSTGILFDGVDDFLPDAFDFPLTQPETIYIKFKQVTWTQADRVFDGSAGSSGAFFQDAATPKLVAFAGTYADHNLNLPVDRYGLAAVVLDGASTLIQINENPPTNGDAGSADMNGFTLAARAPAGANFGNIEVQQVRVYNVGHSAAERAAVMAEMGIPLVAYANWYSAVTPTSLEVNIILSVAANVRLEVDDTSDAFGSIVYTSGAVPTTTIDSISGSASIESVFLHAAGLIADTLYWYRATVDGVPVEESTASFRTAQTLGIAKSQSAAIIACMENQPATEDTPLWDVIAASGAKRLINLGDMQYRDRSNPEDVLQHRQIIGMREILKVMEINYTPDDHDYGTDNSHMATPGFAEFSANTVQTYNGQVPHHPFAQPANSGTHVRGLSFTWDDGKVRYVEPDLRSFAEYETTLLGDGGIYSGMKTWDGEAWMRALIDQTALDVAAGGINLFVICSSRTWAGLGGLNGWEEKWSAYQAVFSEYLADNDIPALVVNGDCHQLGFSSGTTADFTSGKGQIPFIASSGANIGSAILSSGPYDWNGAAREYPPVAETVMKVYALLSITEDGDWTVEGFDDSGATVLAPASSTDATPELNFTSATATVNEDTGMAEFAVEKDWFTACSCTYDTADGTAVAGVDYTAVVAGELTWLGVGKQQMAEVPIINRPGAQGSRTFTVTLTAPVDASATIGATLTITVTINDAT